MGHILSRTKLKPALEFIGFQNDNITSKIEAELTSLSEKIRDNVYTKSEELSATTEVKNIEKLIKDRFGLTVVTVTDGYLGAVLPFYSNRHHIFLNKFLHGSIVNSDQRQILKQADVQEGTVNTEKVYVTGIFSEFKNELYMNYRELFTDRNMTVPEVSAILFHELGHAFYACEYADRLETNNQIIADVFREATSNNPKKDMVYMYREIRKVNPEITEKEVENLVSDNKIIAGYTWFKVFIGSVKSQLPESSYDRTSFETSADNFASRFGYGRVLVSALEKWHTAESLSRSRSLHTFAYLMSLMYAIVFFAAIVYSIGIGSVLLTFYLTFITAFTIRISGSDIKDMTYDDDRARYKRIRNDMIEFLKREKADPVRIKDTVESIKALDKIIDGASVFKSFYEQLADIVFTKSRNAKNSIEEQKLIESLLFNDLFVKSAELKTFD